MEANQMVEENSEKLTINISVVDLGKIDYLVDQGYYANRTDFLRSHEDWLNREFMTKTLDIGIVRLCSEDIKGKEHQDYTVLGMLIIDESVTLDDLKKAFRRIRVFGKVKCSSAIKEAYSL